MPGRNEYPNVFEEPLPYAFATPLEYRSKLEPVLPCVDGSVPARIKDVVSKLEVSYTVGDLGAPLEIGKDLLTGQVLEKPLIVLNLYELTQYKPPVRGYAPVPPEGAVKAPGVLGRLMGAAEGEPLPQRVLACHWSDARVAVVGRAGDAVYVLDTRPHTHERVRDAEFFEERMDARVREIRAVAWRPYCLDTLTAGCAGGVALWDNARRLRMLQAPGHTHVTAVAWCSDGARLLSTSATDGQLRLWDVASGSSTVVCAGSALAAARFSPDLLAVGAPRTAAFRLWHLDSGRSERWGQLCGPPAAMAWCPKKPILVVAPRGEAALHFLAVDEGRDAKLIHTEPTGLAQSGPGGTAISIAWDPTGERLAVAYEWTGDRHAPFGDRWEKDDHRRFAVALYATTLEPAFSMNPIGYVQARENGPPMTVDFRARPKGQSGAVLVTAWATGAVSFTQLIFKPSS